MRHFPGAQGISFYKDSQIILRCKMAKKPQKKANKIIKANGGQRMRVKRAPITKTRRAWDMTKAVEKLKNQ